MKYSMMPSMTLTLFTLITAAHADILPDQAEVGILPSSHLECLEWAGADDSRNTLCDALESCERTASDSKFSLINCIADAKAAFHQSRTHAAAGGGETYVGESFPISTNEANADYWLQGPDSKGWKNAEGE